MSSNIHRQTLLNSIREIMEQNAPEQVHNFTQTMIDSGFSKNFILETSYEFAQEFLYDCFRIGDEDASNFPRTKIMYTAMRWTKEISENVKEGI